MKKIFRKEKVDGHIVYKLFGHKILSLKTESFISGGGQPKIYNDTIPEEGYVYMPNQEKGIGNIELKLSRVKEGGCFEWPNMIAENKAIGKFFLNDKIRKVANIGSGVGTFEYYNAETNPDILFCASEFDTKSVEWCKENRPLRNVIYGSESISELLEKNNGQKYDLAVCVDVIEHIKSYKAFLDEFSTLSDKAVITTPNRDRYCRKEELVSPPYEYHVQEFNAGEFYFILKMYYKKVTLYAMPDVDVPQLSNVGIYTTMTPLVAFCEN